MTVSNLKTMTSVAGMVPGVDYRPMAAVEQSCHADMGPSLIQSVPETDPLRAPRIAAGKERSRQSNG